MDEDSATPEVDLFRGPQEGGARGSISRTSTCDGVLPSPSDVGVTDENSDPKKGRHNAGLQERVGDGLFGDAQLAGDS